MNKSLPDNTIIRKWLDKYRIENYTINDDLSVDVDNNGNKLTSFTSSPKTVGGNFSCDHNKLINLARSPKYVGGNFWCVENPLKEAWMC